MTDKSESEIIRLVANSTVTLLAVYTFEAATDPDGARAFFASRKRELGGNHALVEGYDAER